MFPSLSLTIRLSYLLPTAHPAHNKMLEKTAKAANTLIFILYSFAAIAAFQLGVRCTLKQRHLPAGRFDSGASVRGPRLHVVPVVAPLAERGEVVELRRLGAVVVDVSYRQNNAGAGHWMRLAVLASAPLAPIPCPVEPDEPGPELPVLRVSRFHFVTNRHRTIASSLCATRCAAGATLRRGVSNLVVSANGAH